MIKQFLKNLLGKLDHLIVNTPPETSDKHLSIVVPLNKANPDGIIMVTIHKEALFTTIRIFGSLMSQQLYFCYKMNTPILGIIKNRNSYICSCNRENTDRNFHE
jgi:Mrp family chromosome partitioning ATPase